MFTQFQRNNLLQFLNRVELKGIDEANAFMELVNIIQQQTQQDIEEDKQETTKEKYNQAKQK